MNNSQDTFAQLRQHFDGQDVFMTGGHQIIKTRRDDREVPAWAKSNKQIQTILLRSFPLLKTDPRQRVSAARWAVIIQLFFRMQMTRSQVVAQTKLSENTVRRLIQHIRCAANGKRTDRPNIPRGVRPRGRPKK